jgi:RNA recognition motif-containing protein
VSKRITPSEVTRAKPGKHHYAFVDMEDEEEALKAIRNLDGILWNGTRLKVRVPVDLPEKIAQRGTRWGTAASKSSDAS